MTKIAAALVKAQSQIEGAKKDSTNPHYRNKYADLGAVWDACRDALHKNGFSVVQMGELVEGQWALLTILLHESGEQLRGYVPLLNTKGDMQGLGSAITYARRYGLAAIVGVCPEDDDGNAASERPRAGALSAPPKVLDGYDEWLVDFEAAADNGPDALLSAWQASPVGFRQHMPAEKREALKARAAKAAKVPA
jgi:hypothetical protein